MILIITSCSSREEAEGIATALDEGALAASVQIQPATSVYRWKGRVEKAEEQDPRGPCQSRRDQGPRAAQLRTARAADAADRGRIGRLYRLDAVGDRDLIGAGQNGPCG